jgi:hypothetical protein
MGRSVTSLIFGMLVVVNAAGCSFVFVTRPPDALSRSTGSPPPSTVNCTSSVLAPVVDTAIASYQVFRTGAALKADRGDYAGAPISRNADIGFGVGLTGLFLASAVYGFINTSECSTIKQGKVVAPPPWVPPTVPAAPPPAAPPPAAPPPAAPPSAAPLPEPQLEITTEPLPAGKEPSKPEPVEPSSPEEPFNPF